MHLEALTLHKPVTSGVAILMWDRGITSGYIRKPDLTITTPQSHQGLLNEGIKIEHPGACVSERGDHRLEYETISAYLSKFGDALQELESRKKPAPAPMRLDPSTLADNDPRKPFFTFADQFPGPESVTKPVNGEDIEWLREQLDAAIQRFQPEGWFACQCVMMGSSQMGKKWLLPYGGQATHPAPPEGPFSVSGQLASDQCVVIATLTREQYGSYLESLA